MTSTNAEPHRSYSSLVTAQTSACLSWIPEFPWVQQTLAATALIARELAACFLLGAPQLRAPTLSCSQHGLFIQLDTPTHGSRRAMGPTVLLLVPWVPGTEFPTRPGGWPGQQPPSLFQNQSWMVQKQTKEGVGLHFRP